jgi:hypothetical protein
MVQRPSVDLFCNVRQPGAEREEQARGYSVAADAAVHLRAAAHDSIVTRVGISDGDGVI